MPTSEKMICPDCGHEMNHHAEKVDYEYEDQEQPEADLVFGGIIQEIHSCPGCGRTLQRTKNI